MSLTPEQLAKIQQKESTLPDALRRDALTNYREGYFFVTINTAQWKSTVDVFFVS